MVRTFKLLSFLGLLLVFRAQVCAQIDPSIVLRSQPVQIESPLDAARKAQQLKLQQQEIQRRQMELDQYRQHAADRQQRASEPQTTSPSGQLNVPLFVSLLKPDQFAAAGLAKLDASEMAELNSWFSGFINAYTKLLYDGFVPQKEAGLNLDAQPQSIEDVREDGELILLLDGSEWRVQAGESIRSALWLPVSGVLVVKAQNSSNAILIHQGEVVHAQRIK